MHRAAVPRSGRGASPRRPRPTSPRPARPTRRPRCSRRECTFSAMPSLSTYAVFLATALVLLAIPGPAVLYVVTGSIEMGRAGGLASVAGITTGTFVHVTLATAGLSSLILASKVAFDMVKYVGAAYLIALGVRRLLTRGVEQAREERAPRTLRRAYTQGIV